MTLRHSLYSLIFLVLCSGSARAEPVHAPQDFDAVHGWADVAAAVDPAVVSIRAALPEKSRDEQKTDPRVPSPNPEDEDGDSDIDSGGSGFLISADGLIVTNEHVVDGALNIRVHIGSQDYNARVRGMDRATDIALLQVDAGKNLPYLELGDSDGVRVGDWVMALGNPLRLERTVTTGVVSAKGRRIGLNDVSFEDYIQTDAAINLGNSGGPLVDIHGRVIGITTAINFSAENIGFAVPVNTLRDLLPQLRDSGKVVRGALGAVVANVTALQARAFGATEAAGAMVNSVADKSPAEAAGIEHGDIILAIDGHKIEVTRDLILYVASKPPGAKVMLDVLHKGKVVRKEVTLFERPGLAAQIAAPVEVKKDWPGIHYEDLTTASRSKYGIPQDVQGIVVSKVSPSASLKEQSVRSGCVISELDGSPVKSAESFRKALEDAKPGAYLKLYAFLPFGRSGRKQPFFAILEKP